MPGTAGCWRREVLHVDGGDVERRVEAVARQVARVEDDAVGEVDLAEGEGAAAGLEVPAGVDDDLGVVAAVGVVAVVALKAVPVAWSRPPLPTTICAP